MEKHIYFVTTNSSKFKEVDRWIKELDPKITLEQASLDIPEIQSLDVEEVAIIKAKDAWNKLQKTLLIDDGGVYLEKYKLFPGTLTRYVYETIGIEGILKLAAENRNATFTNCLVYITGPEDYQVFLGTTHGKLVDLTEPIRNHKSPFDEVLIPDGANEVFYKFKEKEEEKKYHFRYNSLKNFINWLNK